MPEDSKNKNEALLLSELRDQIDDIELAVNALEQSAYKLDAYSKQLGNFIYKLIFIAFSRNDMFNFSR